MLFGVAAAFDPPLPLTVSDRQHVLITVAGRDCAGLSIIEPEGRFGFDMLTWVEVPWRHQGIGTAMKHRAVQNARSSGITALWAPGDTRSVAFYKSLGVARQRASRSAFPRIFRTELPVACRLAGRMRWQGRVSGRCGR